MASASDIRALVVTLDPWLGNTIRELSQEVGIAALASSSGGGVPEELGREKFEALLVDFDTVSETAPILATLRGIPSNRAAVVLAVATGVERRRSALSSGANFVFERPLQIEEVRRTLKVAYELMHGDRRRYFRCAVDLSVTLSDAFGNSADCTTMNISSSGMGVNTPISFKIGDTLEISFALPSGDEIEATGLVAWDDKHGKSGLHFQCSTPQMQRLLDAWLDAQFALQRAKQTLH